MKTSLGPLENAGTRVRIAVALALCATAQAGVAAQAAGTRGSPPTCGNGVCDGRETFHSCPEDCQRGDRLRQLRERRQAQRAGPPSAGLGPGDHFFSFKNQEVTRQYYVYMPPCYDGNQPIPLVLNFHGGGGSAEGHRDMTGMETTAKKECFAVAYPRGLRTDADTKRKFKRFWNVPNGPAGAYNNDPLISRIDDAAFVNQLLDDIASKFRIDQNRIYATGLSNGGVLSHELACQFSGRIAAIASVSGPFWTYPEQCQPERAVSLLYFHGTADVCAPYNGGPSGCEAKIAGGGRVFISAQKSVDIWKEKNDCADASRITYQNGDATCYTYNQCAQGAEVVFCSIEGGGHTWPGGKGYKIPGFDIGPVTNDVNANDAMWEFFQRHPMPQKSRLTGQ